MLYCLPLPAGSKEMPQKGRSLLGKHAGSDGDAMIHSRMIEYSEA